MRNGLLDRLKSTNRQRAKWIALSIAGLLFSFFLIAGLLGLRVNASPSLPIGLYLVTQDNHARLVEFCPVEPYASLAAARGYRSRGTCPDGAAPFMKRVVAKAGDQVCLAAKGITVNGSLIPNTEPRTRDSSGRSLLHWPFGAYTVVEGHVWVVSSYHARSFDSRYFGPIQVSSIRNHLRPLLTAW